MTFPFRLPQTPEFAPPLPDAADIVVIGGGVIGVSTALFAARKGHRVVLLEKGRIAAEQSSRNWGWVRVQGRDLAEIPVAQESQLLWQDLDAECGGRLGLRTVGVSFLARDESQMTDFADWAAQAKPYGVDSRLLSRDQTTDLLGGARGDWAGALHTPSDMKAEPWVAVPELARLAREAGVTIVEQCAVRGLDLEAGRVAGVITEAGRIKATSVVLAGGAWSSLFLRRHGVDIPQLSVRSTALATGRVPQVVSTASVSWALAMRPRDDGGVTLAPGAFADLFLGPDSIRHVWRYLKLALQGIFDVHLRRPAPKGYPDAFGTPRKWADSDESPFERMRVLNPPPNPKKVPDLLARFAQTYPQVGEVPLQAAWAGMIDVLPDVVPVVDRVAQIPGLTVCTGMCGHGFGAGPGFGRITADLAAGDDQGTDIARFRMGRFFDGSTLVPGPNL